MAAVVLAAGGSSRLGTPKQLVRHGARTLLERAVEAAASATDRRVIVVVGAEAMRLRALVARRCSSGSVDVVHHPGWRSGLAGSLKRGMRAIAPDAHAVLFVLSDQPLVDRGSLERLIAAWRRRPSHAAAARYSGRLGVPAILPRRAFRKLRALEGDEGARGVLAVDPRLTAIDMPEAAFDVDTREDLALLGVTAKRRRARPGARARASRS